MSKSTAPKNSLISGQLYMHDSLRSQALVKSEVGSQKAINAKAGANNNSEAASQKDHILFLNQDLDLANIDKKAR